MPEPLDGTTTRIEILRNGAAAIMDDAITEFSDEVNIETRTRTLLGRAREERVQIVRGWRGTISLQDTGVSIQQFESDYLAAVDASEPNDVTIIKTEVYADLGTTRTTQYVEVTMEGFSTSSSATANTTRQLTWYAKERVIR